MKAMVFEVARKPLRFVELEDPVPQAGELLIQVHSCGVCRTDLHIFDGELDKPKLPLILGHEIVGTIIGKGSETGDFEIGQRVGVAWLANTCRTCKYCINGKENLCDSACFTGYTVNGGYATKTIANASYCFLLPDGMDDGEIAPTLCAGLIGWRTLKLAGDAEHVGIYGFGAAAHIVAQIAIKQGKRIYAFTREGDREAQEFARELGASWAGASSAKPPVLLDAALIFAPVGNLIPLALQASSKGASIVSGGIHMSDIPSFPYDLLWHERSIKSVANLTKQDGIEFFEMLKTVPLKTTVVNFKLSDANDALRALKSGQISGAAVLDCRD